MIGFILIFGFLVVSYSIVQAYVVPNQNATIEYNHYQEARSDMVDLYAGIVSLSASTQSGQVLVPVSLGTEYPARLLFLNPPPASGQLGTSTPGSLQIRTVNGTSNTTEICGGTSTSGLTFTPGYYVSSQPSIRYEHGLLYVDTNDGGYAIIDHQPVVDDTSNTINIYRLTGRFETRGRSTTLPVELTGTKTYGLTTVKIEDNGITLPSKLPATEWNDHILPPSIDATQNGSNIDLSGFSGEEYTLRCYTVGLGEQPPTEFRHSTTR
ncbi:hypothetical protein [Halobaculum limi]|uniref:hypothetical protein n=1 Tax=Halobaculum limi TaxID=3031916 RepID=UPI0024075A1F|nr:hypothetical protein [Halobaculum sp. YSMS11]